MEFHVSQFGGVDLTLSFVHADDTSTVGDMLPDFSYFEEFASGLKSDGNGYFVEREDFEYVRSLLEDEIHRTNEAIRNDCEFYGEIFEYEPDTMTNLKGGRYEMTEKWFTTTEYAVVRRESDEADKLYPKLSAADKICYMDVVAYKLIRHSSIQTGRVYTEKVFPRRLNAEIAFNECEPITKIEKIGDVFCLSGVVYELVEQWWYNGSPVKNEVLNRTALMSNMVETSDHEAAVKKDSIKIQYQKVGTWWTDRDIDLVKIEDGRTFALHGWNGVVYTTCWEVGGDWNMDVIGMEKTYSITPVYDWNAWNEEEETFLTDSGEEWDGIVDYSVYEN